jgi:hypothetical protein
MKTRLGLILILPLLAIDCFLNWFPCFQSIRFTMSGEAWHHRDHRIFGITHRVIDAIFLKLRGQTDHCRKACEAEARYGGAFPRWAARWRELGTQRELQL